MWSRTVDVDLNLTSWKTLLIDFRVPSWTSWWYNNAVLKRARNTLIKWSSSHKLRPVEVKWVWKVSTPISFWRLPNWDWWTWA